MHRNEVFGMRLLLSLMLVCSLAFSQLMGVVAFTGSMYPTYKGGEYVNLEPADKADVGDVVVFQQKEHLIMHRVIFEYEGCYITKGDDSWLPDWGCADVLYKVEGQNSVV